MSRVPWGWVAAGIYVGLVVRPLVTHYIAEIGRRR